MSELILYAGNVKNEEYQLS